MAEAQKGIRKATVATGKGTNSVHKSKETGEGQLEDDRLA
jgi:hypothetical protein